MPARQPATGAARTAGIREALEPAAPRGDNSSVKEVMSAPAVSPGARTPPPAELAPLLPRLRRALRSAVRRRLAAPALATAQVELLVAVDSRPGVRVRDAATLLQLAPNTVSTLVGSLSRAGLLERRSDPADGRSARLHVTADGAARIRRWREARETTLAEAVATLDATDLAALAGAMPALDRLAAALERLASD